MNLTTNSLEHVPDYRFNHKPRKILLVEDEPFWQAVLSTTLKSIDPRLQLRFVRNKKHAENALFQSSDVDLIIADFFLEGKTTGLDLWRQCHVDFQAIPFIILSGIKKNEWSDLIAGESITPLLISKNTDVVHLKRILALYLELSKI